MDTNPEPLNPVIALACDLATGTVPADPSATARRVRAARRKINARGRVQEEWYRMVWRQGAWSYFAEGRMPRGQFMASERDVTLFGDAFAGEIICQHDRGQPAEVFYLVVDRDDDKLVAVEHRSQRDGLAIILPSGAQITVAKPRS